MEVIVGLIGVRTAWTRTPLTSITFSLTIGLASLSTLKGSQKIARQIERAILRIKTGREAQVNGIDD
jgi:hypothetical protein